MQAPISTENIPPAQAGPISDELLERLIIHAGDAQLREISEEGGTMLIMCAAPLLEELLKRRRAMEVASDIMDIDNVVLMRPPAGDTA